MKKEKKKRKIMKKFNSFKMNFQIKQIFLVFIKKNTKNIKKFEQI